MPKKNGPRCHGPCGCPGGINCFCPGAPPTIYVVWHPGPNPEPFYRDATVNFQPITGPTTPQWVSATFGYTSQSGVATTGQYRVICESFPVPRFRLFFQRLTPNVGAGDLYLWPASNPGNVCNPFAMTAGTRGSTSVPAGNSWSASG